MNKVRVGSTYIYDPVLFDVTNRVGLPSLNKGDTVKVVNQYGCPPAGTMGQCYVERDGQFMGMVCVNSLRPRLKVVK